MLWGWERFDLKLLVKYNSCCLDEQTSLQCSRCSRVGISIASIRFVVSPSTTSLILSQLRCQLGQPYEEGIGPSCQNYPVGTLGFLRDPLQCSFRPSDIGHLDDDVVLVNMPGHNIKRLLIRNRLYDRSCITRDCVICPCGRIGDCAQRVWFTKSMFELWLYISEVPKDFN